MFSTISKINNYFVKINSFQNVFLEKMKADEYKSYWDMLPPEVQDYIIELKRSQEKIEEDRRDLMFSLCQETKLYVILKEQWGLGKITWKVDHCRCKEHKYLKLSGHYLDEENVKKQMYLGHGYQQALSRVNHVKSFL